MRNFFFALALLATLPAQSAPDPFEQGRSIYLKGVLADGSPVHAIEAGGVQVSGASAACVRCHQRSGLGSREGELPISPITGPILFSKPQLYWPVRTGRKAIAIIPGRQDARAAYDDASLARAIRNGVDASDQPLHSLMPRYALSDADLQSLVAYLRELGATPAPGVSEGTLRLATILTPDAPLQRSQQVAEALTTWSASNPLSNLRLPLDVWQLEGDASTWGAQLLAHYRRQPVFAVLSGAGGANWQPVAAFCEEQTLPCLFPIVDSAPNDPQAYYNLYLDTGLPLEARLLARHLSEQRRPVSRIVQLVDGSAAEGAAQLLGATLAGQTTETVQWNAAAAQTLAGLTENDVLVAWLRPAELQALFAQLPAANTPVFVSARLAEPATLAVPAELQPRLRWVSTRMEPQRLHANNTVGLVPWAQHLGLPIRDEALQAEVYAATYFFSNAMARMRGLWSREHLLEKLESGNYTPAAGKLFYSLSLGSGQRVAAKAGHILGLRAPEYREVVPLSPRLVP
jgi:mono/diheme cytochrome c family protein